MTWQDELIVRLKQFEGSVSHMYLDSVGLVTVGVGSLLRKVEDALPLPFVIRSSGEVAPQKMIRDEWEQLKAMGQNNNAASYFKKFTLLDLPEQAINDQVQAHTVDFLQGLRKNIENLDSYPDQALLALLDMTFNLGLSGVLRKFPSFVKAFRAQDWSSCQKECNRLGISVDRNDYVKGLFGQLMA